MSSTFGYAKNGYATSLASPHVAGDGQLVLAAGAGAALGALPAGRVYRVCAVQSPGTSAQALLAVFEATGRTGDTLTGVTAVESSTDINLAVPTPIRVFITAKYVSELQDALNALEVLTATTVFTTGSYADPSWLTSLAGSKIVGNIAGNAASLTGSIAESQVTNLVTDLATLTTAVVARALDSAVVHNTGTETIAGAKTFSTVPVLGTLTGILKAATGTVTAAAAGTDYLAPSGSGAALTGITASQIGSVPAGVLKGSAGAFAAATGGTDFVVPTGVAGGQTISGGTASGNSLTLQGSANATKGPVIIPGDGSSDIARWIVGGGGGDAAGFLILKYNTSTFGMQLLTSGIGTTGVYFSQNIRTDGISGVGAGGSLSLQFNNGTTTGAHSWKLPASAGTSLSILTSANAVIMDIGAAGLVGIGVTAANALGTFHVRSASGSTSPLVVDTSSSAASVPSVMLKANSSTTASQNVASFDAVWATSTHASRKGRVVLSVYDATAAREALRLESDGAAALVGFYGASAVAKQTVTGSRGGNAALASLLTALASLGLITDSSS